MIAFKTHASNPNKKYISLNYYPWQMEEIAEDQKDFYSSQGWSVMTKSDYEVYCNNYQSEVDAYQIEVDNEKLKIFTLVDPFYRSSPPSKIDFTMHLKNGILLEKKVVMHPNGRPLIAKYYWPDSSVNTNIVAEIKFEFIDNASGFMIERKELLGYYLGDNTCPEHYMIHNRKYDFNSVREASESLQERVDARSNIVQEVKIVAHSTLVKMFMMQGKTIVQANGLAIQAGSLFFEEYRTKVSNFIEVASSAFKETILADTTTLFLNEYCAPNVTLRQYIYGRLSY